MYRTHRHHRSFAHRPALRALAATAAVAIATTGMAACEDDDTATTISAEACAASVDLAAAFGQAPEDPAEFGPFVEEVLVPIGETLAANLTGDAGTAAGVLHGVYLSVAESGDASALESPEAVAARTTVGAAIHGGCDLEAVSIEAIEYAFVGAPDTLPAGRVSFELTNNGVEEHELVLFRRADGVTESLDELLAMPEDSVFSKLEFVGVTFGGPDTTNYVTVDLEPGTYFLVCFIPQGEDGPPHFMGGMKQTISVA